MKKNHLTIVFSVLILIGFFISVVLIIKNNSSRPDSGLLPASVGRILEPSTEHILVKFKPGAERDWKDKVFSAYGLKEKSEIKGIGVKIVLIPSGKNPQVMVDALNKNEKTVIEFAEPDFRVEPSFTPNDPWYANWQKDKVQINLPLAWDSATGASDFVLAIVDTGVNCSHEDLTSQCVAGWNFYDNNSDTSDVQGHGTSVAGVASALGNNNIGIAGNSWKSKIMPLRVSAEDGSASYSKIASAITYAGDNGAKVVNASYQIGGSSTIQSAARYLKDKGGLLVVSEGNYGADTGYTNSPDIISVSALDSNNSIYSWSSFGNDADVGAPGCTGATTLLSGGYGSFCGTSNSAPEVAGLLMLVWSVNPNLSPDQMQDILFNSAKDLGASGWDKYYGWGIVDAGEAITLALGNSSDTIPSPTPGDTTSPVVTVVTPTDGAQVSNSQTVSGSATDDAGVVKIEVVINGVVVKSATKSSITYKWSTRGLKSGTYIVTIRAYDQAGNIGQSSVTVSK